METFTSIIRELEAERNQALSEKKTLQVDLHRLTQEMSQMKHFWDLSKREIAEMKQVFKEVEYMQGIVQKKDEERMEMMNHINYLDEEKTGLELLLKQGRSDLSEAEKEIFHLRHCLQEKDIQSKILEEKLQVTRELVQKRHLSEELSQCKNALHMSLMHEKTLRHELSNVDKLEAEIGERNRTIKLLKGSLEKEKRTVDELMEALRVMRKDMDMACLEQQKGQVELEGLNNKMITLTSELSKKQEEHEAIRRNVEDIHREIRTIKKDECNIYGEELVKKLRMKKLRTYDASGGDQRDKFSPGLLHYTRRIENILGESSEIHSNPANGSLSYVARSRGGKLFSTYLNSGRPKESIQPMGHLTKMVNSTSSFLLKNKEEKFRTERLNRRHRTGYYNEESVK